jgi:hypothetical protein
MDSSGKKIILVAGLVISVFIAVLSWWLLKDQPLDVSERVPGMDHRPKLVPRSDSVIIGQNFDTLGSIDEIMPGDWPRFRGTGFDNISRDTTPLRDKWDTAGPRIVWRTTLGEGYAGPAVHNGRVTLWIIMRKRRPTCSGVSLCHPEKNSGEDGIMLTLKGITVIPELFRQ